MDKNENEFYYSYSAEKQRNIDRIIAKYTDDEENKFYQLVKLDERVETFATVVAIVYAIVSVLVFGTGMSIALSFNNIVLGSIVGLCGIIMLFFISGVRRYALDKRRKKMKPEIMALIKEINNNSNQK